MHHAPKNCAETRDTRSAERLTSRVPPLSLLWRIAHRRKCAVLREQVNEEGPPPCLGGLALGGAIDCRVRIPPPDYCGKTVVLSASPLVGDRYAGQKALAPLALGVPLVALMFLRMATDGFALVGELRLGVLGVMLIAWSAWRGHWVWTWMHRDPMVTLDRRALAFFDLQAEERTRVPLRKIRGVTVGVHYRKPAIHIVTDERTLSLTGVLSGGWLVRDLAALISFRARAQMLDPTTFLVAEALAVTGSDACVLAREQDPATGEPKVRTTFQAADLPAVLAEMQDGERIAARAERVGELSAFDSYRWALGAVQAIEVPESERQPRALRGEPAVS
jgi:hypothetical protein